jgi:UDP-2,3-diacylglucosamine pyrophosphatase LpxH
MSPPVHELRPYQFRAIWISDVHLGFRGCQANFLLDFLRTVETEYLYLVGDIIDIWNMKKNVYWPQEHNNVIRTILGKAKHGTKVIYVPGNHDEVFREYDGMQFGNLKIQNKAIHTGADGRRYLIMHGDEFDSVVKCSKMMAMVGNVAYDWLLWSNRYVNYIRRAFGRPYWSLAAYLKHKVKNAVNYISNFEHAIARAAEKEEVDAIVCGHIHRAEVSTINDVLYCNDGDWVESCSALGERHDGSLHLIHWTDVKRDIVPAETPNVEYEPEQGATKVA